MSGLKQNKDIAMKVEVGKFRLALLRGMYILIVVGLALSIWPGIFTNSGRVADSHTVVSSFLAAVSILAAVGVFYPLKLLPILFFELIWKSLWLLVFALPMHLGEGLDDYAKGNLFAVIVGIVLTAIAVPWCYVFKCYFKTSWDAKAED